MIAKLLVALGFLVILMAEVEGLPAINNHRQADDRSALESATLNTLPQPDDRQKKKTTAAYDTAKAVTKPLTDFANYIGSGIKNLFNGRALLEDRSPLESPTLNTLPQADDRQKKKTTAAYDTAKAVTKPLTDFANYIGSGIKNLFNGRAAL